MNIYLFNLFIYIFIFIDKTGQLYVSDEVRKAFGIGSSNSEFTVPILCIYLFSLELILFIYFLFIYLFIYFLLMPNDLPVIFNRFSDKHEI